MKLIYDLVPYEAQEKANFVISLPNSNKVVNHSFIFRQEDFPYNEKPDHYDHTQWSQWCSAHFCSYHFIIEYKNARLRCKQFLYDLGPLSTLDHGALYDHWVWKMKPHPFNEESVCWIGYDYMQAKATSFLSSGTNIELRLVEGYLEDEDFVDLCKIFSPIQQSNKIFGIKFSSLSYWSRYDNCLKNACINNDEYQPPSSIWKIRWPMNNIIKNQVSINAQYEKQLNYLAKDFVIDSIIQLGDDSNTVETQFVMYPRNGKKNQIVWLRIFNENSFPLKKPASSRLPALNSFSGFSNFGLTVLKPNNEINSSNLYIATVNNLYGPHDAIWWGDQTTYLLQISASAQNSLGNFRSIFSEDYSEDI